MGHDSDYNMRHDMAYADVEPVTGGPQDMQLLGSPQQLAELFAALAKASGEFGHIEKNREVTIKTDKGPYTFSYAELSQSIDATRGALSKHGVTSLQPLSMRYTGSSVTGTLRTMLTHAGGGMIITTSTLPEAKSMKDFGGHVTYARRYAYNAMLSLAADEDLDDKPEASRGETGAQSGPRTPKQEEPRRAPSTPQTQAAPKASAAGGSMSTSAKSSTAQGQTRPTQASSPTSSGASTSAPAGESPKGQTAQSSGPVSSTTSSQPQTSSKPANDSSKSAPSQASTPAGEVPKAQGVQPPASTPASSPATSTASRTNTTATTGTSAPTSPSGDTPLTEEQRSNIYAVLGKLGIPAPRAAGHLTAVMNRIGLPPGKVTGETYQRVVDALNAELPAGG